MGNSSPYLFEKYYRFVFVKKAKNSFQLTTAVCLQRKNLKNRNTATSIDPFETGKCVYDEMQWMDDYEE